MPNEASIELAAEVYRMGLRHLRGMLELALDWRPGQAVLVVHDRQSELARVLADLYREACPEAEHIDFDLAGPVAVRAAFDRVQAGDLVVMVQSTRFWLEAFRPRVELFRRGLKVVEHLHLSRMAGPHAVQYLESLAYDPDRLRPLGQALHRAVAKAESGEVKSVDGGILRCHGPFEKASLNVGDYSKTKNVGGQFPIGEVFTEARDLESVRGRVSIFAYGDVDFRVAVPPDPIILHVLGGHVVGTERSTPSFDAILDQIRADEGVVWVREWGFGLNRAFAPERIIPDVGTFERMNGLHFSLGAKHQVYPKPNFGRRAGKHHLDVFVALDTLKLGDQVVFQDGDWRI